MKNCFKLLATAIALVAATSSANAQLYLSGNFSMNNRTVESETTYGNTTTTTKNDPVNTFTLGAEVGYYFNSNMAVGADLLYSCEKTKNAADKKQWTADNMFYFNPYFRFDFVSTDKINLGVKARALLGFGKYKDQNETREKISEVGVGLLPVLNYNFNNHWGAGVSFGEMSYKHYKSKTTDNENKTTVNTWDCDLTLRGLTFSVVYTF